MITMDRLITIYLISFTFDHPVQSLVQIFSLSFLTVCVATFLSSMFLFFTGGSEFLWLVLIVVVFLVPGKVCNCGNWRLW